MKKGDAMHPQFLDNSHGFLSVLCQRFLLLIHYLNC